MTGDRGSTGATEGSCALLEDVVLVASSGLMDIDFYARCHPHLVAVGGNLVEHYLLEGWRQRANPGPAFSTHAYLDANDDVRAAGWNPLVHYLRLGRIEGRPLCPPPQRPAMPADAPAAPAWKEWESLAAAWRKADESLVDIILPGRGERTSVLRRLFAILSAQQTTPYRLVVAGDCGSDAPLRRDLEALSALGLVSVVREQASRAEAALAVARRDVVLLAPGTEVFGDWLDRLRAAAMRTPRTGVVTPISNSPEVCGYPHFARYTSQPLEVDDAALDRLAARVNACTEIEIPTTAGYCVYLNRACLDEIGWNADRLRDGQLGRRGAKAIHRRAAAAGWRTILATDVFVRSSGEVAHMTESGAAESDTPTALSGALDDIQAWRVRDFRSSHPTRRCREALDLARLGLRAGRGAMLFVTHRLGGGTERHVQDMARMLESAGIPVFFCRSDPADERRLRIEDPLTAETPNLPSFELDHDLGRFVDALRLARVAHVHVHHFAGLAPNAPDFVRVASAAASLAYDVTIHDYMAVCPRINLIDRSGIYCGEPKAQECERCIARDGSPFGRPSVWEWRERYARLLGGARRVFVPDSDVADRMRRFMPDLACTVRPHTEPNIQTPPSRREVRDPHAVTDGIRRIALLGTIHANKGLLLLAEVARAALARALPLEFVVIGSVDRDEELQTFENITVTGPYDEGKVMDRLSSAADLAWISSVCPETYSYTLSIIFSAGLMPIAFDIGAVASRIRVAGWGDLMPISWMLDPDRVAEHLSRVPLRPPPDHLRPAGRTYPDPLASYYGLAAAFGWPRTGRCEREGEPSAARRSADVGPGPGEVAPSSDGGGGSRVGGEI